MIESITVSDVATYGTTPEKISNLSFVNFFFGSNGSGKTTIGRVIAEETKFPTCSVTWKARTKLETLVYNCDFVDRNFNQSSELKGVFTLGEKQVDTLAKIDKEKQELDALNARVDRLSQVLFGVDGSGGKEKELGVIESNFKTICWAQKQKHDVKLQGGFEGYRNSSERFKDKVLQEFTDNKAELLTLADLESKAEIVFGPKPTKESAVPFVASAALIAYEANPILKKRVIGREDVDVAAMIKKLENSDWVREGISFYKINKGTCPFCQQSTSDAFAESLIEYFDETFAADNKAIGDLSTNYAAEAIRVQQQLASIVSLAPKFLDVVRLKAEKELLDTRIALNSQRLAGKKKEPSQVVELESLSDVCAAINNLIDAANSQVAEHNRTVENLANERSILIQQVWKFVTEELKADLISFVKQRDDLGKAIANLKVQIENVRKEKVAKEAEIRKLEKEITSIQPTIDGINRLLLSFGFQSFKLAKAASGNSYQLIRADGSDAKATLSEGEKTFVTFLYFYHLLKGNNLDSGITTDRIVVFDDPVSSLDSDILFIVSSLIKGLFEEVRNRVGNIRQVFVLTHNVYFHKEITYNPKRREVAMNDESFWIVRKSGLESKVESHTTNPIKTSYELLWAEVRKPDRSNLTIQNTLRRILENYFKILGGIDFEQICAMFVGKEKLICKSLCSWVHDGSHYAHDDLYVSIDDSMVDSYIRVFRAIFEKSGHKSHYEMMMGDVCTESVTSGALH